eukprot:1095131-Pleurochrysis_carterae.AAC.1
MSQESYVMSSCGTPRGRRGLHCQDVRRVQHGQTRGSTSVRDELSVLTAETSRSGLFPRNHSKNWQVDILPRSKWTWIAIKMRRLVVLAVPHDHKGLVPALWFLKQLLCHGQVDGGNLAVGLIVDVRL